MHFSPGYPIDGNRWSENQSINQYQSIKFLNWYRLVSVNRWSIDNHTKPFIDWYRLAQQLRTVVTHATWGSSTISRKPWGRNWQNNSDPGFPSQRKIPASRVLELPSRPSLPFFVIMSTQDVREEASLNMRFYTFHRVVEWNWLGLVCEKARVRLPVEAKQFFFFSSPFFTHLF